MQLPGPPHCTIPWQPERALHSLLQPEAVAQPAEPGPHPTLLGEAKRFPRVVLQVCIPPSGVKMPPSRGIPTKDVFTILGEDILGKDILTFCRTQGCAVVWLCILLVSS